MTHNFLANFKLKYFQLWTKKSNQSLRFQTYKCSGENLPNSLCYFSNQKLVFLQILHHCLISWKITPLDFCRSNITRKDQSKCKFLGLLSARIKIHQMPFIFETTNQFSFSFFCPSWVPSNITSLYFLSWSIIYFDEKQPIKVQIFEIFECLGQHLVNSSCQFWTSQFLFNCFSNTFFIVITHNFPVNFELIYFLVGKVPIFSPNFQVLWWKLAKFLMLFSKPHISFSSNFASLSSVMRETPLYFFRSNIT